MVLDRFNYRSLWYYLFFFGVIPAVLELSVLVAELFIWKLRSKYRMKPGKISPLTDEEIQRRLFKKY